MLTKDPSIAQPPAALVEPTADAATATTARNESMRRGLGRVAGISASLVGTQALTSVLGLVFWTLAARTFSTAAVGAAGAAVSMMMLLGSLGSLGLGTLLIARLPLTPVHQRRLLVRTSLAVAGVAGFLLALVVPVVAIHVFGADNLRPIAGNIWALLGLAAGTGLMSVVMVLDQAVLTIGVGSLQLERNVLASVVKIGALLVLGATARPAEGSDLEAAGVGMIIFLAWTIGTIVSMPLVAWRTRGGRQHDTGDRWVDLAQLKGLGRMAVSHHALNTTLQAALQILPILVTLLVSSHENAFFNAALMVCGFVFALPYSIAIGLFASAGGRERDVLARMRVTLPFSMAVSILAYAVLFPLGGLILGVFGPAYADEGLGVLRLLALAGIPFVLKDHFVALRRVQGRTTDAVIVLSVLLVVELGAAVAGGLIAGTEGLVLAWLTVMVVEAIGFGISLRIAARGDARRRRSEHLVMDEVEQVLLDADATGESDSEQITRVASATSTATDFGTGLIGGGISGVSDLLDELRVAEEQPGRQPRLATLRRRLWRPIPMTTTVAEPEFADSRGGRIGTLFGPVVLLMALGVAALALSADAARTSGATALTETGWIAGQVLIFLPAAIRVLWSRTGNRERVALVFAVGIAFQLSRRVLYPTYFALHDELLHANTLREIEQTGHLFSLNSLLPVSGYYPGLELVTDWVMKTTGLSALDAGTLVLLLARVVMIGALIGVGRAVTRSTRVGAIGALLYLCNPQFLFFNSQFSYQSLALPLAVFVVYAFLTRNRLSRWSLALPVFGLGALTFVHHLTAFLVVGALGLWLLAELALRGWRRRKSDPVTAEAEATRAQARADVLGLSVMTTAGLGFSVLAMLNSGNPVSGYLTSIAQTFSSGVTGLATGSNPRKLFADGAGFGPEVWERPLLIGSVLIAGFSLLAALRFARAGMRARKSIAIVLGLIALAYPIIPGGHLTQATSEVGDRAAGFVYVGLAVAVAWWLGSRELGLRRAILAGVVATVAFLGAVILGAGPTARQLPGPYLVSADSRSIDPANTAAAQYLAQVLPPNTPIFADRVGGLLAAAVGDQFTVRHLSTGVDASRLLLDPNFTDADVQLIRKAGIQFLLVDTRLSQSLPHLDVYIETGEFQENTRTEPVSPAALEKFAAVPGVDRIYDNGSVQIYDLRGLSGGN